ncbi:MAG: glycosyltransferase family 4 protein [Candidatus Manganitrophus sp. SB1]|nr:glycosyltransferase family 4 protein [Candidatus Manganitrophus morganii]
MRLTFVIGALTLGGAERTLAFLAKHFMERGHAVSVVTLYSPEKDFYALPSKMNRKTLGMTRPAQIFHQFPLLRRTILSTEPEVIISFLDKMNVMTLTSMWGTEVPVIVSERTDPSGYSIGPIWDQLRWWTYRAATRIVVQSKGTADYFLPKLKNKVSIIPNPVTRPALSDRPPETSLPKPYIVGMGRLVVEKRFDLLIRAFAQIKDQYPEWTLVILGEGPLRGELERLRDAVGLAHRLLLPGRAQNPDDLLKQADLFVLSSRVEGFPNALCEAMACGLPVIATDCPSGPREIVRDGIDGLLVPNQDEAALSKAMDRLMSNEAERRRLAARAVEVVDRFGVEKVAEMWEVLFAQSIRR